MCCIAHEFEMEDERITYEEQIYIVMYGLVVVTDVS